VYRAGVPGHIPYLAFAGIPAKTGCYGGIKTKGLVRVQLRKDIHWILKCGRVDSRQNVTGSWSR
jgi:hypothetical protein